MPRFSANVRFAHWLKRAAIALAGLSAGGALMASELRQVVNFNREWSFQLGDAAGADAAVFDDAQWENIGLPHSFSMPHFAANAKAVSNCPPVTLAIVSGPGELPTGPSITFVPDSDIAIRDGEAAMEFRSYYAGKTVIRATSPGLKEATVEITSLGEPKFVLSQTPAVQPRPHVRFTGAAANAVVTLGTENPTLTSSEAPGHSGRLANDGNPATFWQAAAGDTNAWWRVDLERIATVQKNGADVPGGRPLASPG